MSKRIALVGHCGPDSTYLRMTVMKAAKDAQIVMVDDDSDLQGVLKQGVDLLLFNRELEYGFSDRLGVDVIKRLRGAYPGVRTMLVSNYPEAQAEAVANGAMPGFGKREIGSPRVLEVIRAALEAPASATAPTSAQ